MKVPDSLQTFDGNVFAYCSKLVPSTIDVDDKINDDDVTSEVVAYLRAQQMLSEEEQQENRSKIQLALTVITVDGMDVD
ncbi:hypothetical protein TrVE_jg3277 [Triparma verrucosa]|uniref:Uncharacterized protein n=1 Tax=Triparma verrucosa TaxID=1606542 RepID=A0A9W7BDP7_9STRA|nr:hypothetical protein TrVE_jg3277 [Triparma verrucosa]